MQLLHVCQYSKYGTNKIDSFGLLWNIAKNICQNVLPAKSVFAKFTLCVHFSGKLAPILVKKGFVKWIELLRGYGVLC